MLSLLLCAISFLALPNFVGYWYFIIWGLAFLSFFSFLLLYIPSSFLLLNSYLFCDSMSLILVSLSCWIFLLMMMASQSIYIKSNNHSSFCLSVLSLLVFLVLSFSLSSIFFFYFFFEASLIPTLFLILGWGYQPERLQASLYMMIYTIAGSLPLLIVIFLMKVVWGSLNMPLASLFATPVFPFYSSWICSFLFVISILAFLVKMPMFSVHLWLPKAHVEAPVAGSMVLAAILLKLGGFGIIRILQTFLLQSSFVVAFFFVLALWGGMLCSMMCFRQVDLKSLIAYSSIGHMSLVIAGAFSCSSWGWNGAVLVMISHGFCSSGLFALANYSYEKTHSRGLLLNKGMLLMFPYMTLWWFLFSIMNMAAPPSINLMGELIAITASLFVSGWIIVPVAMMSFLSAFFSMYLYTLTQHGSTLKSSAPYSKISSVPFILLLLHWVPCNLLFLKPEIMFINLC